MTAGGRVVTAPGPAARRDAGRRDEVTVMTARHKLNAAYAAGSLAIAALIGGAAQSAIVFWAALGALLCLNLVAGDIRPKGR
jgi:hypothetical protein